MTDPTPAPLEPADVPADEPRRHRWVWAVYLALYAVAIPWYWPADFHGPAVLGFPAWVAVSLLAAFALAVWTAVVIQRTWQDDGDR